MDYTVSCSAILDYVYCKRRWYLHYIEREKNDNVYMIEGKHEHEPYDETSIKYIGDTYFVTNCLVYNLDLNLFGYCDEVSFLKNEHGVYVDFLKSNVDIIVTEHKHGVCRDCLEYKAQLASQIMCFEFMYNCRIDYGYIHFMKDDKTFHVDMTNDLRKLVIDSLHEINQYVMNGVDFGQFKCKYSKKCRNCSMYDICNPKAINIAEYMKLLWKDSYLC